MLTFPIFRWQEGNPKHQMAFMTFGGGPRLCIGNKFALIEEKLILAMLLKRYTLEEVNETRLEQTGFLVLAPSDIKVRLVPRFWRRREASLFMQTLHLFLKQ